MLFRSGLIAKGRSPCNGSVAWLVSISQKSNGRWSATEEATCSVSTVTRHRRARRRLDECKDGNTNLSGGSCETGSRLSANFSDIHSAHHLCFGGAVAIISFGIMRFIFSLLTVFAALVISLIGLIWGDGAQDEEFSLRARDQLLHKQR